MREYYDAVVAGTGIAGLTTAIRAAELGLRVLVVTKADSIEETNTNYAQGGIIAGKEDRKATAADADLLAKDIFAAGCDYNNPEAVRALAADGPDLAVEFLARRARVPFSRNSRGEWDYTGEAAHSERRILHFEDHTGDAIQASLIGRARELGVEIRAGWTAIDLVTNDHHSTDPVERYRKRETFGLYALENGTSRVHTLLASAVVLATGGLGNIFQFTTNPSSATGDGISIAARAGAEIINAEFVQFHPTALFHKDIKRFLVSESLRGEGAKLVDKQGRPFMHRYDSRGELAPRDVVTRAIYEEMSAQGIEYVYLDLAGNYRGEEPIERRFSRIWETCLTGGIDITREPIPVVPAAHYSCGGVKVDLAGRASVCRLYAVGEVSCTGVHGANRLASTSMLEGLLWGVRAAEDIAERLSAAPAGVIPGADSTARNCPDPLWGGRVSEARMEAIPDWKIPEAAETFERALIWQDWKTIKMTMWNHAGIVRTKKGLERAMADLEYHAHRITKFYREAALNRDIIELRNGVETARIVVAAAMHEEISAGCHFRKE